MGLLGDTFLTDTDCRVMMRDSYFVINMSEICEYFDIEIESVFNRE
jgi:hypothetical protein